MPLQNATLVLHMPTNITYDNCMINSGGLNVFGDSISNCINSYIMPVGGGIETVGLAFLTFVGFFLAFTLFQNTNLTGKLVVMVPILLMSAVFIGWMWALTVFAIAFIAFLAIMKINNK